MISASSLPRFLLVCVLLLGTGACRKAETVSQKSDDASPKLDACSLISRPDVEAVVGSKITDTKSSEHADGGLRVSQCFYNAEVFSKSVSLSVTQADSASSQKRSPKQFWKETFGRFDDGKAEEQEGDEAKRKSLGEKGEEETAAPPKKVDGLTDAAYWTANRVGGSLYALKNDLFVRVSVGGADNEQEKLEKSKKLAQKALDRL